MPYTCCRRMVTDEKRVSEEARIFRLDEHFGKRTVLPNTLFTPHQGQKNRILLRTCLAVDSLTAGLLPEHQEPRTHPS